MWPVRCVWTYSSSLYGEVSYDGRERKRRQGKEAYPGVSQTEEQEKMRVETDGTRVTCHCSYCPTTHSYEGNALHAIGVVAANGWTIERHSNVARCVLCTADYGRCLYETLRRLVTQ